MKVSSVIQRVKRNGVVVEVERNKFRNLSHIRARVEHLFDVVRRLWSLSRRHAPTKIFFIRSGCASKNRASEPHLETRVAFDLRQLRAVRGAYSVREDAVAQWLL